MNTDTGTNKIKELLLSLGICDESSISEYFPRVRDRDDVSALRCAKSGVIFLSRSDHMDINYYNEKDSFQYWSEPDRAMAVNGRLEDTDRRVEQFRYAIANKAWLDVGTGSGAMLDALGKFAARVAAVEPQDKARNILKQLGYTVYRDIGRVEGDDFQAVTLFHVFEHFTDPVEELKQLRQKMAPQGKVIIEVPHANDFLLSFLDLNCFKAFTLWSEHLILHTRLSLTRFLEAAGFSDVSISGYQRYPLANHMHWLAKSRPGGHLEWDILRTPALDVAYSDMLARLDRTDTLIAVASNG